MDENQFSSLDLAFSAFLVERSGLAGRKRERLRWLVAELSRGLGEGHSCLPVPPDDEEMLRTLAVVGDGRMATPLVLFQGRLYLHRYFSYERELALRITELARTVCAPSDQGSEPGGSSTFFDQDTTQQRAVDLARGRALTIICGGPGTGKTTTVVAILAGLLGESQSARPPAVALAAPTGKAAMRLGEAVGKSLAQRPLPDKVRRAIPTSASTLHRLLGMRRGSPNFIHNRDNPLGWDIVVVDEASMVDLAMMTKLVESIKPGARLILLGDKDQLASVESGAVLADLIAHLPENTVELTTTYRFEQGIKGLAEAVKAGDGGNAWQLLQRQEQESVVLVEKGDFAWLGRRYGEILAAFKAEGGFDPLQGLTAMNRFRVLCAVQHGRRGVEAVNHQVELSLAASGFAVRPGTWYAGRPVLVTCNDYGLGLFNGDTGLCLRNPDSGELRVWFQRAEGELRSFTPSRLPECQTVYAMTIHKSQGSEFEEVAVVLPEEENRILGRELLYTGLTRAKKKVWVMCGQEILRLTVARTIERYGGLGDWLRFFAVNRWQRQTLPGEAK